MAKKQAIPREAHWRVTITLTILLALIFFWPYLGAICFAAISAYLFYGLYRLLDRYLPDSISAGITMVLAVIMCVVPIAIVLLIAVTQGITFATGIAQSLQATGPEALRDDVGYIVVQVNSIIEPISNGQLHLSVDSLHDLFANVLPGLLNALLAALISIASSIPALITYTTVYLFMFFVFLMRGESLANQVKITSPFASTTTELYFSRVGAMIKASIVSQLLIAFILAVLTALLLTLIGGWPYLTFLIVLLTLLNMVPLGSAPLIYVLCAGAILAGNVPGGIIVLLIYTLVICNIDNFMRPRLIPKSVRLNSGLMVLSIFCGLFYFGGLGLFYGPIIAIILVTTFETYTEYREKLAGKHTITE